MATFIVLCNFDASGVEDLVGNPSPQRDLQPLMDQVGAQLTNLWFCVGQYDIVAVVEAPDLQRALAFLVAFSSRGRMRTVTLAAESNWSGVLDQARDAAPTWGGFIDRG